MSREVHVRFCEGVGVKLPRATRLRVLAPSRWKLRKAVQTVNAVLGALCLEKHPDKTFIGRTEKGFDFLGYHFGPDGLSMAERTIERFVARALRLYEQEPGEAFASSRFGLYVRRWVRWVQAGLPEGVGHSACLGAAQ